MVSSESGSSDVSSSPISPARRSSQTLIPGTTFSPACNIGIAIPYQNFDTPQTFLLDPTPVETELKPPSFTSSTTTKSSWDLGSFDELPKWAQDNPFIHCGYRPISNSAQICLHSCFHTHNETFNIWSHFIPCIIFIILEGGITYYLTTNYPNVSVRDHLIFAIFMSCAIICLGVSAIFHSLISHSKQVRDFWLKLDFTGIILLIIGCFISAIYMTFYCEHTLQYAYWGMIIVMSATTLIFLLLPAFQGHEWRSFRTAAFCATAVSVLIPFIHAIVQFGPSQAMKQSGMPYYFGEAVLLLMGVGCFAKRWPESWMPGSFDLIGSSHQIFHLLVVLALGLHLAGLLQAFDYNYGKRECGIVS